MNVNHRSSAFLIEFLTSQTWSKGVLLEYYQLSLYLLKCRRLLGGLRRHQVFRKLRRGQISNEAISSPSLQGLLAA